MSCTADAAEQVTEVKPDPEGLNEALFGDPAKLAAPIKAVGEKWKLVPAFLQVRGLVKQQIASFDFLIGEALHSIVLAEGNRRLTCDADPDWFLRYTAVRVGTPTARVHYADRRVTPHDCRLRDMTYSAPITVDIEYLHGRTIRTRRDLPIGRMPIMLRSARCVLAGASEAELIAAGECPLDPGGYFVVRGAEKVILIQEQLSKNRALVELDGDGDVQATVTSTDEERKTVTRLRHKRGVFVLQHTAFERPVNVATVLRAMGVESDQEICSLVGGGERLAAMLAQTLADAAAHDGAATQRSALLALMRRSRKERLRASDTARRGGGGGGGAPTARDPADEALELLATLVVSHVPAPRFDMRGKVAFLAVMLRRMLHALLDAAVLDDRDYYGNKRLELAGGQLALLFEDLFKRMNGELLLEARKALSKASRATPFDAAAHVRPDIITHALEAALATGCWNIKRFKMDRKGATQVLSRLSFIGAVGMMTRVVSQFEKTRKVSGPRALQPSQWGLLCPCDTPEGESCGLVKNLALMTHVTTDEDPKPLARLAFLLGVQPLAARPLSEAAAAPGASLVLLNGSVLGSHPRPRALLRALRAARRAGAFSPFASAAFVHEAVQLSCDGGRLCRPLLIVERGAPRLEAADVQAVEAGEETFMGLAARGVLEFLDVNEEADALVALDDRACGADTTHMELEPFTVMGVVSGLIPFPHHNQSPRNTYQCAMGKQAMGNMAFNQHLRMDTLLYLLVSPQRPLVSTRTLALTGFERLGAGQNAIVCVMSYSGYDIEDAIVMNKASLDRGFGRCNVLHTHKTSLKQYANRTSDRLVAPAATARFGKYRLIEDDGLAAVGQPIAPGDVYAYKQAPSNVRDPVSEAALAAPGFFRPQEARLRGVAGERAIVERVLLAGNDDTLLVVKTLVRHVRRPELGDKFSSRHGQKGVVGAIVAQEDLPFSAAGIVPDLIMNPHGFPSRMTVGKLLELLASKSAVLDGRFRLGTAFGEAAGLAATAADLCAALVAAGYSYSGKDMLTSGITGEPLAAHVFMGPIYYQKLKHMVVDKVHARARGPRVTLTRQPTEGRSRDGGLRLGEMERDCLVAYGASGLLLERLMISSDAFTAHVDQRSGLLGWWDARRGAPVSPVDGRSDDMLAVKMPYACKLLFQELQSMNIVPRIQLRHL